jgi:hypothetical protein
MKTRSWAAIIPLCAIVVMFSVGSAAAANGTLKLTFKYKDPTTGVEQNLNSGYIYLHDAAKPAPMEKFFSKADYILGTTTNGIISVPVPAGKYYIRVLRRKVVSGAARPYGPPESGDLTWFQTSPITIIAGATLDLGTKYATPFGTATAITGTVKTSAGVPIPGRYVRLQTRPCTDWWNDPTNFGCGTPVGISNATDANGNYRIEMRDPGTYYLVDFSNFDSNPGCSGYCAPPVFGHGYSQPVTIQSGDTKTVNIVSY